MGCMPMPHDASVLGESFEATGEIVWLQEFERTAGVQFVELADGNRKHIRQWLSFEADRKSTRLNSSHGYISYAVFCLKKKNTIAAGSRTTYVLHPAPVFSRC